jgi:microcystin-dependent protein
MSSLLPTPEPPDPVEGALGHFDHSNWVKASLKALDEGTVHSAGGTVSGVLNAETLTVNDPASEDAFVDLVGNRNLAVRGKTAAGVLRWRLNLGDGTAEGGGNSGTLFSLLAYSDAGALLHTVLKAARTDGLLEVKGSPTSAKGIATKEYVDNAMPIGAIIEYGGNTAPPGWHLCNGTAHGSAALQAIIGSPNAPDLTDLFIVGAGGTYPPHSKGGAATVTLTAAQSGLVGHTHAAGSGNNSVGHTHNGATGSMNRNWAHAHGMDGAGAYQPPGYLSDYIRMGDDPSGNAYGFLSQTTKLITPPAVGAHTHNIYATDTNHEHGFTTGGESAVHNHIISITAAAAAAAAQAHENLPPYYALVRIIKKV